MPITTPFEDSDDLLRSIAEVEEYTFTITDPVTNGYFSHLLSKGYIVRTDYSVLAVDPLTWQSQSVTTEPAENTISCQCTPAGYQHLAELDNEIIRLQKKLKEQEVERNLERAEAKKRLREETWKFRITLIFAFVNPLLVTLIQLALTPGNPVYEWFFATFH